MKLQKADGILELGYGIDGFKPGEKVIGMHTNGPASVWWRHNDGPWARQTGHWNNHWQVLAYAANTAAEFMEELRK